MKKNGIDPNAPPSDEVDQSQISLLLPSSKSSILKPNNSVWDLLEAQRQSVMLLKKNKELHRQIQLTQKLDEGIKFLDDDRRNGLLSNLRIVYNRLDQSQRVKGCLSKFYSKLPLSGLLLKI